MTELATARLHNACYCVSVVLVVSGLVHLGVFFVDDRPWEGPLSWRKPTTFGLSFGLTLATTVWVTSYLRLAGRTRGVLLGIFAMDCCVEVAGIVIQAWRNVPSHLNTARATTPTNAAIATPWPPAAPSWFSYSGPSQSLPSVDV